MSLSQTLTEVVTDERAWTVSSIDDSTAWFYPLSEDCLSALDAFIQDLRRDPRPITEIRIQDSQFETCEAGLHPILATLNSGRGFAIVDRVPEHYTVEEAQAMYWLIGQLLGRPFEQNVKGTLLYDVRDTGQDVTKGARFSVTNKASSFHSDNAFGYTVPDFVGLLCLQTAKSGGESQLISAYALHNELLENFPDVLETLYQPFYFDRRGQFKEGEAPVSQTPIFQWDGQELTLRYLHYYIQIGHQKVGQRLSLAQEKALEVVETLLRRPELRVEFRMQPGQMFFMNNRWTLHNRTEFEDYVEPERRRHYVRLWLSRKG